MALGAKNLSSLTKGFWSLLVLGAGGGGSGYGISTDFSAENVEKTINKVTEIVSRNDDKPKENNLGGTQQLMSTPSSLSLETQLENKEEKSQNSSVTENKSLKDSHEQTLLEGLKESNDSHYTTLQQEIQQSEEKKFEPNYEVGNMRCIDSVYEGIWSRFCSRIYH
ncbi:hypothetical protein [Mycoplasma suis]|uniref:Uncharacterized protein n=1 Tax=Mycoplasma suis (strain Illinois) TaxID=768700 RepID=F0QS05_MYCSL|nr:hypothetical protein [Mycoplasma suis]ADX98275.1 hypothetical protein MSU_0750 [Mycoplasma suis str. Illinois]